jgi:hypothetical protein
MKPAKSGIQTIARWVTDLTSHLVAATSILFLALAFQKFWPDAGAGVLALIRTWGISIQ